MVESIRSEGSSREVEVRRTKVVSRLLQSHLQSHSCQMMFQLAQSCINFLVRPLD